LPAGLFIQNSAYVAQVDAASGNLLGTQWIGGSRLNLSAAALSGSTLWIAGPTNLPDVPFSPGALSSSALAMARGAYLGAVDFSRPQPAAGTPQIGCVLDAADASPAGPVARYQLLTIFGTGLGPAVGVSATDNSTTNLAGVSITSGTVPAILLYVSSTQINLAVPNYLFNQTTAAMQVTVNGLSSQPRQFPLSEFPITSHLFINASATYDATTNPNRYFVPLTLNGDGSLNSAANPAMQGSTVSVFVNGLAPAPGVVSSALQLYATSDWKVEKASLLTPFVVRVDLQVPALNINASPPNTSCDTALCNVGFQLYSYLPSATFPSNADSRIYVRR
jgi:uncharacterized protein (TIGR03437 family)